MHASKSKIFLATIFLICLIASTLVSPVSARHVNDDQRVPEPLASLKDDFSVNEDITKYYNNIERTGRWYKGERGGTKIFENLNNNDFWYTYDSTSHAYWHFGDMRGRYKAEVYYPSQNAVKAGTCSFWILKKNCKARPPSASPQIKIWECNRKDYICSTVFTGRDRIRNSKNDNKRKEGWWGWNNITLDGYIIVEISKRYSDDEYRLAAGSFRFLWEQFHQDDVDTAIKSCEKSIETLYELGRWGSTGLASLNPVTGVLAWVGEIALNDIDEANKQSLISDCGRQFRNNEWLWLGPVPLTVDFFLSSNRNADGSLKGITYDM